MCRRQKIWGWLAVGLFGGPLVAQASTFQGQDANGAFDNSCTVSGAGKCAMYYDATLNIEILNNWSIGRGSWSQAQALAETAGFDATGLTGWVLPTGNGSDAAGSQNQYLSIWNAVGSSLAGLQAQFDGAQASYYWSGSEFSPGAAAWLINAYNGSQSVVGEDGGDFAVAVRAGEISAVPLPGAAWLLLSGLLGPISLWRRKAQTLTLR